MWAGDVTQLAEYWSCMPETLGSTTSTRGRQTIVDFRLENNNCSTFNIC